jgi:Ulp1 family protease
MYFYGFWIYFFIWPFIFHFVLRPIIKKTAAHKRDENVLLQKSNNERRVPPHEKSPGINTNFEIFSLLNISVLSTSAQKITDQIWNKNISHDEVLVNGFGASITRKDLLTLSDSEWLNDEGIINLLFFVIQMHIF